MKIYISKLLVLLCLTFGVFAISTTSSFAAENKVDIITVSEKVPGAGCTAQVIKGERTGMYECKVERGFGSIMSMMGAILKYFTYIAGLLAVLALVVGGIMYSMGGADENLKVKAKEYIIQALLGLIVLLLSGSILYAIAPWVYK